MSAVVGYVTSDRSGPRRPWTTARARPATTCGRCWHNEQFDGTITFAADGTFAATNGPYAALADGERSLPPGFDKATARIDMTGRWQSTGLHPGRADDRKIVVRAMFDKAPEIVMTVPYAARFAGRYGYRKCTTCAAVSPASSRS
ncbi:hypothetical protein ACFFX1_04925 [Dactylosporangium sucinum]|uniref:Uncharacterized protein n=1 Tax=Dactylosporangium sucinum TaxID=1424081 RepID=A0A917WV65_9ACTN|nr:hypothetical protein [Dactylosporangium sucinum]GGM32913.1 hypothetical protein GCM10007977_037890 [Dactylosporangium sucinum]